MSDLPVPVQTPVQPGRQTDRGTAPQGAAGAPCVWALVPCAGVGHRSGSAVAKQYQLIAGQPLVIHTLAAFAAVPLVVHTLVVVAPGDGFLSNYAARQAGRWSVADCGGHSRAATVANGLVALQAMGAADTDWVLVHDAARCLITPKLITRLIEACWHDAVGGLLAHPVTDTLKVGHAGRVVATPDRSVHWSAQTPQMFRWAALREALASAPQGVTDESSAMESRGLSPLLVPGSASNFKVTFAQDFALAQAVLLRRSPPTTTEDLDYDYP